MLYKVLNFASHAFEEKVFKHGLEYDIENTVLQFDA